MNRVNTRNLVEKAENTFEDHRSILSVLTEADLLLPGQQLHQNEELSLLYRL